MKNLFFTLTFNCNAFCEKCMTRKHINRNLKASNELIDYFVNALKKHNYKGIVSLGSGESLTSPQLISFAKKILSINDTVKLRILTNGVLFDSDKMDPLLKDKRIIWGVTLDGFYQDDLANLQYGVDIELVKANVEKWCKSNGPNEIYVNYTLNSQNIKNVYTFIEWALETGIKDIYITELKVYKPFYEKLNWAALDYTDVYTKGIIERIKKDERVSSSFKHKDKIRSKCWTKDANMPIIDIDGTFTFCSGREDFVVGNILDSDAEEKWKLFCSKISKCNGWCAECQDRHDKNKLYPFPKHKYEE